MLDDIVRTTNSDCPIWKYDILNRYGVPIRDDLEDEDFGRIRWDEDKDYYSHNPWASIDDDYIP